MQVGDPLGAYRTTEGIMLHTVHSLRNGEPYQVGVRQVLPGDADWTKAVAMLPADTPLPAPIEAVPLELLRHQSVAGANRVIGETRQRFITDLPGQDMVYLRKEQEARDWLARTAPIEPEALPVLYPLLAAELGVTAPDPDQLAQIWLNMSAMWIPVAAALEHVRLRCVTALQDAATPDEIYAAMTAFYAELASLTEDTGPTNA